MTDLVKKSFNLSADLARQLDAFVDKNPGLSLTLIMQQALEQWLSSPNLRINVPSSHTNADIDAVLNSNATLMTDLGKRRRAGGKRA
jgi:hypothetical protein